MAQSVVLIHPIPSSFLPASILLHGVNGRLGWRVFYLVNGRFGLKTFSFKFVLAKFLEISPVLNVISLELRHGFTVGGLLLVSLLDVVTFPELDLAEVFEIEVALALVEFVLVNCHLVSGVEFLRRLVLNDSAAHWLHKLNLLNRSEVVLRVCSQLLISLKHGVRSESWGQISSILLSARSGHLTMLELPQSLLMFHPCMEYIPSRTVFDFCLVLVFQGRGCIGVSWNNFTSFSEFI